MIQILPQEDFILIQVVWVYILIINSNNNNVVVMQPSCLQNFYQTNYASPVLDLSECGHLSQYVSVDNFILFIQHDVWETFLNYAECWSFFFSRWLFWGIVFSWLVCQWLQNGVTSYDFFYLYFMCKGEWKSVFEKACLLCAN